MNEKPEDNKPATDAAPSPAEGAGQQKTVPPLAPEDLFVITELAKVGFGYLKAIVSNSDFKVEDPDPERAKKQEEHLRGLVNIAGPDVIARFDRMCQFLYDSNKEVLTPKEKETPNA